MSVQRAIRRRRARKSGTDWPGHLQPFRDYRGGYEALHPTKGWRGFSMTRLAAMHRLAELRAFIDRKMGRG